MADERGHFIFSFQYECTDCHSLIRGRDSQRRPHPNEEISTYNPDSIWIVSKVSEPSLTIFLPPTERATGTAIIICPGGGYINLAMGYEGYDVARRYNEYGITAFVLKYRIPDDSTMLHKETGPFQDAQRALQLVRSRAVAWGIRSRPNWDHGFFGRRSPGFNSRHPF